MRITKKWMPVDLKLCQTMEWRFYSESNHPFSTFVQNAFQVAGPETRSRQRQETWNLRDGHFSLEPCLQKQGKSIPLVPWICHCLWGLNDQYIRWQLVSQMDIIFRGSPPIKMDARTQMTEVHSLLWQLRLQWQIQDFKEGDANYREGCPNLLFFKMFAQNRMKMKEYGPRSAFLEPPWIRHWIKLSV